MNASDHQSRDPAPFLVEQVLKVPLGLVLDIACGYGRNAFFLAARKGNRVLGFDQSEAAVDFCNREAKAQNLPFTAQGIDLEKQFPSETEAAAICCFYYLDRNIIPKIKQAVKIGGVVVYETFLIDQHQHYGKPARTAFCWEHNELLSSFLEFRILFYHEGQIFTPDDEGRMNGRWVAQLIAERRV